MKPQEIARLLEGKTIAKIEYGSYLKWEMTIEAVEFTDGTLLELGGNADVAYVHGVTLPNGVYVAIDNDS